MSASVPLSGDASPRSLREAMACKVACIVTDIPGARELVVDGQTGMIIRPDSPEAIAASIGTLARIPKKRKHSEKPDTSGSSPIIPWKNTYRI